MPARSASKRPPKSALDIVATPLLLDIDATPIKAPKKKKIVVPTNGRIAAARGCKLSDCPYPIEDTRNRPRWEKEWRDKKSELERNKYRIFLGTADGDKFLQENMKNGFHFYCDAVEADTYGNLFFNNGFIRLRLNDESGNMLSAKDAIDAAVQNEYDLRLFNQRDCVYTLLSRDEDKRVVHLDIQHVAFKIIETKPKKTRSRVSSTFVKTITTWKPVADVSVIPYVFTVTPADGGKIDVIDCSKMLDWVLKRGLIYRQRHGNGLYKNVPLHLFNAYKKAGLTRKTVNGGLCYQYASRLFFTTDNIDSLEAFEAHIKKEPLNVVLKKRASELLKNIEGDLDYKEAEYERKSQELAILARSIGTLRATYNAAKTSHTYILEKAIKDVSSLPGVVSVEFDDYWTVKTEPFWYRPMKETPRFAGEFEIRYSVHSGRLEFRNLNPPACGYAMTTHYYPGNSCCLGSYDGLFHKALLLGQYDVLFNLALDFVREPHLLDPGAAGTYLKFPLEEPKKRREPTIWVTLLEGHSEAKKVISETYLHGPPDAAASNEDEDDETNF